MTQEEAKYVLQGTNVIPLTARYVEPFSGQGTSSKKYSIKDFRPIYDYRHL